MSAARIALVATGGEAIGLGHVMRSRRLADAVERAGVETRCFAQAPDGQAPDTLTLEAAAGFAGPLDLDRLADCAAVILDVPRGDRPEAARRIKQATPEAALILIGGESEADPLADLLIRQTLSPAEASPRTLAGPDALLLPETLFADRPASPDTAASALFCLGGGKRARYGEIVAALVAALPDLTWRLAGPDAEESAAKLDRRRVEVIASQRLCEAMLSADLAVIAGGGLVHEAAAAQLPALYLPLASNQEDTVRLAASAGLGRALVRNAAPETIAATAAALARDGGARARMQAAGREVMRPGGPERCAEAVLKAAGLTAS